MDVDTSPIAQPQQIDEKPKVSDQELVLCLESSQYFSEFKTWKPLGQYFADITIDQLH